jgi:hypothetical protein
LLIATISLRPTKTISLRPTNWQSFTIHFGCPATIVPAMVLSGIDGLLAVGRDGKSPVMSTGKRDILIFFGIVSLVAGVPVYGPARADTDCETPLARQFGALMATGSGCPK